ncbi:MAG: LysR family transcriptional regulator [Salinivirgaceae bacterium]|jgi:molybdate transport system regulatory protein|nr:LysR family transcriptional regulator [Salinivirgaceae bacterium]
MAGSKGSKYYNIFLDYSILLNHKKLGNLLDEYKFSLLKKVKETGSLKAAADALGVSYRKAWGNVEEIEAGLGFKLLERQRGGSQGGKTDLTEDGEKLIQAYEELRIEFNEAIHKTTKKFFHSINEKK